MKRCATLLILFVLPMVLSAQNLKGTWLLSNSPNFIEYSDLEHFVSNIDHQFAFSLQSKAGYFISNSSVIGGGFTFEFRRNSFDNQGPSKFSTIRIPLYFRQYFTTGKWSPYVHAEAEYGRFSTEIEHFSPGGVIKELNPYLGVGLDVFLNENVALEAQVNYKFRRSAGTLFIVNGNEEYRFNFNLGVQLFLNAPNEYPIENEYNFAAHYFKKRNLFLDGKMKINYLGKNRIWEFDFNPSFRYFMTDRMEVMTDLIFSRSTPHSASKLNIYGFNAGLRYHLPLTERWFLSGGLLLGYSFSKEQLILIFNPSDPPSIIFMKDKFLRSRFEIKATRFLSNRSLIRGGIDFLYTFQKDFPSGLSTTPSPAEIIGSLNANFVIEFEKFITPNLALRYGFGYEFFESEQSDNFNNDIDRFHFDKLDLNFGFNYFISGGKSN